MYVIDEKIQNTTRPKVTLPFTNREKSIFNGADSLSLQCDVCHVLL